MGQVLNLHDILFGRTSGTRYHMFISSTHPLAIRDDAFQEEY
jgi:hypothetical protein